MQLLGSNSGTVIFTVTSNVDWSVTESSDWLTATKTNSITLTVSYIANTNFDVRSADITISGTDVTSQIIIVYQAGFTPAFESIAYYPFNGNANDESGNGYDGTISGPTFVSDRFSMPGKALHFPGGSSHVTTSNSQNMVLNETFSICFWIKQSSSGKIIERDIIGTMTTDWNIWSSDDGSIRMSLGTTDGVKSNKRIDDNAWHFVVFLRNKTTGKIRIFIDGVLDNEESGWTNDLTGDAQINFGAWDTPGGFEESFTGTLDEIRLYNRELSNEEISELWDEYLTITNNSIAENNFFIFPNPSYSIINLDLKQTENKNTYRIVDLSGLVLLEGELDSDLKQIDIGCLKPSLFIMQIILNDRHYNEKIIKK